MKLLKGFKSLIIEPTKIKFLGFLIPIAVIFFIVLNKKFQIEHPVVSFFGFWSAIPIYIYILGSMYEDGKSTDNKKPMVYNNYEFEQEQIYPTVSHIEKKTTTTNTTVKTETVYFKEGGNYIE